MGKEKLRIVGVYVNEDIKTKLEKLVGKEKEKKVNNSRARGAI